MRGHLLQKEIQWDFTPPASSHIGGVWERQIRTVRKVLNAILKEQTLDDERLSALFCEVEAIINGRPLTTVSDDPNDECPLDSKLSAAVSRECRIAPPPSSFESRDIYGKRWRHVQHLADQFLKRWVRECLPTL